MASLNPERLPSRWLILSWAIVLLIAASVLRFAIALWRARMKFRKLRNDGIPIMTHSLLFGHLPVVRQFHQDWASDANFIQTFGQYMSLHWHKHFPNESACPPVIYVDVWPIATPMAFSMKAYVSNQMEMGSTLLPKSPMQGEFLKPISNGRDLNCMHGEEWRAWRTKFNPGFSKTNIRAWVPALLEEVEAFVETIENYAGPDGQWGPVFQLEKVADNLAFDTTGRVVVNQRFHSQSSKPARFAVLYREQLQNMEITLNPLKLLWRASPMFNWVTGRRRKELSNILRPFILEGIHSSSEGPSTIVQAAVRECKQEASAQYIKDVGSEEFIEQIFCQLMIFFFGGDDAVSIVIPWMIKHLQANPECIDKLKEEHDAVFGADPLAAEEKIRQSPHRLDALPYTLGVIKETLRLNPATITIREGQPDFFFQINESGEKWPTNGYDLFDSSITIHRDPDNFPQPLDFIPERFIVPEGHELHPPKNVWRGFQLGPRKCIGQEMAIVVLKLVLVMVVRRFDIELAWEEWDAMRGVDGTAEVVEGDRMYTAGKATSHPKDGAPVHVRRR